ncbi:MAG: M48 family metalloprotease [Candidatus Omnitrophica bacterium]|nr:M48 family metalloprotease [Candidatus Omnitrophota bacterium]
MRKTISLVLIAFLMTSCAHRNQSITDASSDSTAESELGEAIHRQILQTMKVYQDQELNDYVRSVGQKIAAQADRKNLLYRFIILEDDRIYATQAPGGYVYITTGLFGFLASEIELAGMLAHEIGMLQYKDPRLSKLKKALNLLLQTGSYVGPAFGSIGALSVLGLVLVAGVTSGEKSLLERVRDADRRALKYLAEAGYDPQGLVDPLRRMDHPALTFRPYLYDYLEAHPISRNRFRSLEKEFRKLSLENKRFDSRRDVYLAMTESVRAALQRK